MNYAQKIESLRQIMRAHGVGSYIVPRTDEYQGEYVAAYAERLAWLTGFTGSAGVAVVLDEKAMAMSDGRYTIQLAQQVDEGLYELANSQEVKVEDWIVENADGVTIGYDPKLFTPNQIQKFEEAGVVLKSIYENLIDKIWEDQPEPPKGEVVLFSENFSGQSAAEKISDIQAEMKKEKCNAVVLTLSDSIAWLLNIRGGDIPYIPVVLSYAIVPVDGKVRWFVNQDKIDDVVRDALQELVEFIDEAELESALEASKGKIWLDPKRSSIWFKNKINNVFEKDDPCILPRACKNETEQESMKRAHVRDGVALVKFLKWFSQTNEQQTELSVEKKLEEYRCEANEFKEPSFSTIAGFGSNGAIVHYRADENSSKDVEQDNLLLLDSGAQYIDGTTDITRTIAVGEPSDDMRTHNTLVLKGHIALARAKFKKGTLGKDLDELARAPLKAEGLNYAHGTGHGVGCYLSVHEEAASISPKGEEPLQAGMIISNEPGYYEEGAYGIRIENLILTKEAEDGELYFETITLAPIDKKLIVKDMLNEDELSWLNNYHARVFETLSPLMDPETSDWLKEVTAKL